MPLTLYPLPLHRQCDAGIKQEKELSSVLFSLLCPPPVHPRTASNEKNMLHIQHHAHFVFGLAIHTVFFVLSKEAVFITTLFLFLYNFGCDLLLRATQFVKNFHGDGSLHINVTRCVFCIIIHWV